MPDDVPGPEAVEGRAHAPGDALSRLLRALSGAPSVSGAADARTLADALWLAASGLVSGGATSATQLPGDISEEPESEASARSGANAPSETQPVAAPATASSELSVRRSGSGTMVRGVPLSLGRADPLADSLAVGRAIQPFRRPWLQGGRSELDVEATVEHYARGGPLVPLFRPAPEPWFEVVVLVDVSLSMSVWEETTRAMTRLLTAVGGFRAVHTWRLEWQGAEPLVRDHHGRVVPDNRVPQHGSGALGRRLIMVFSDCAARGWRSPEPWLLLRDWARRVPVVLVNPLPPRLWRPSALNLPAVQVTGSRAGAHNGTLRFMLPRRLATGAGRAPAAPWTALPVVSCTPRLLGAWAVTLMRSDPVGCGAVLIPSTGRLHARAHEEGKPPRRADAGRLAEAFAHTAPAPAVRLAVLCSGLPDLSLPLLHVLHNEVVPEASPSDLAEVLTSGLFTVRRDADRDPVLVFHPAARQYLRTHLKTHDEWHTRAAFGRHAAAHPNAPDGIAAVLHNPWAETEHPAQEHPFAEAEVASVMTQPPALQSTVEPRPIDDRPPNGDTEAVAAPAGASHVTHRAVRQLRSLIGTVVSRRTLEEAEGLLRLLIEYTHARLPAPAGAWPETHTVFDDLRTAKGLIKAADVADDLRVFLARRGITLRTSAGRRDPAVRHLVRLAADGPMDIQVDAPFVFSWSALASAARSAADRVAVYACPVEFIVSLDDSNRQDGFLDLNHCVRLAEWQGDRQGATVHLRVQTRYGRHRSDSQAAFTGELRALYIRAGSPPLSDLVREAEAAAPPVALRNATLRSWLAGRSVPTDAPAFDWLTRHLLAQADLGPSHSAPTPPDDLAVLHHQALGEALRQTERPSPEDIPRLGRPVREFDRTAEELSLPRYVERRHDQVLREAVQDCAAGTSRMVSLVGPAGSGKSRSGMEAMRELPSDWWLWEPDGSAGLAAVLDGGTEIPPRTVIWLDPGERYLLDRSESLLGEHIAAGLRRRLREISSGPVLVLASLRPEDWSLLTAEPGPNRPHPYALARALCEEGLVVFSPPTDDTAAFDHFRFGPPVARAFVTAALDARYLGHVPVMSAQLLADAAGGYLSDHSSRLTPADLSPADLAKMGLYRVPRVPGDSEDSALRSTYYRLSPYMDRYAGDPFRGLAPPDTLWDALATHSSGPDLDHIARNAQSLGHPQQAERFRELARSDRARLGSLARQEKQARALRSRLHRAAPSTPDVHNAAEEAMVWLRADDRSENAQYVLNGLLSRTELPRVLMAEAIRHAMDWLVVHEDAPYAGVVLGPLLRIVTLPREQAHWVVNRTVEWLRRHGDFESAAFVLRPALLRRDLSKAQAAAVTDVALTWLEQHGMRLSDTFVLSGALRRDDLAPGPRTRAVAFAIAWMRKARDHSAAKFVLRPLLQRLDLTPEEWHVVRALVLDWLRAQGTARDAQFVLSALLARRDMRPEEVQEVAQLALDWLRAHTAHAWARHVLRPLLKRDDLGHELLAQAVAAGEEWRRTRPAGEQPDRILGELLRKHQAAGAAGTRDCIVLVADIVDLANSRTAEQGSRVEALHDMLSQVLGRRDGLLWESQLTGDGETLVLVPHEAWHTSVVPELMRDLEAELHLHANSANLRLRVALHCGEVAGGRLGWQGEVIVTAHRLANSPALRTALHEAPRSPMAALVSDRLFRSAFFGPEHPLAARFHPVTAKSKEYVGKAWLSVAGHDGPPGPHR
ncbi:SAV_2336 N-terminal domain-related protein [Streptomyces cyaneofuscatus]|uniref:SAV_2336 N-terminal domain-related protein n=1 Tax=Streptomyces cyaneofuscatus TaxID=66883 RepID=UPI0033A53E3F